MGTCAKSSECPSRRVTLQSLKARTAQIASSVISGYSIVAVSFTSTHFVAFFFAGILRESAALHRTIDERAPRSAQRKSQPQRSLKA